MCIDTVLMVLKRDNAYLENKDIYSREHNTYAREDRLYNIYSLCYNSRMNDYKELYKLIDKKLGRNPSQDTVSDKQCVDALYDVYKTLSEAYLETLNH